MIKDEDEEEDEEGKTKKGRRRSSFSDDVYTIQELKEEGIVKLVQTRKKRRKKIVEQNVRYTRYIKYYLEGKRRR